MTESARDELLRSFPDMGSALMAQNVLEAEGLHCRLNDLANVPAHALGIWGGMGRSVGLWVRDVDVERANELLQTMGSAEAPVNAADLEAEALAAPTPPEDEEAEVEAAPGGPAAVHTRPVWLAPAIVLAVAVLILYLTSR